MRVAVVAHLLEELLVPEEVVAAGRVQRDRAPLAAEPRIVAEVAVVPLPALRARVVPAS